MQFVPVSYITIKYMHENFSHFLLGDKYEATNTAREYVNVNTWSQTDDRGAVKQGY